MYIELIVPSLYVCVVCTVFFLLFAQDREVDRSALFDHSMKPPVMPPETKKADLYKSPEVFKKLDERAIEVNSFSTYEWYMYNRDKITHI